MHIYTSNELEKIEETYELESITEQCIFKYQLTEGEQGWVDFIGNRYAIAEYIADNTDEGGVATLDVCEISDALTLIDWLILSIAGYWLLCLVLCF